MEMIIQFDYAISSSNCVFFNHHPCSKHIVWVVSLPSNSCKLKLSRMLIGIPYYKSVVEILGGEYSREEGRSNILLMVQKSQTTTCWMYSSPCK